MRKQITLGLLCSLTVACSEASTDDVAQRGALMFDLTQDDVQALHDRYVPEEDISLTTDRLTAPFDCALYDDLCAQIGVTQAIEFTEQLIELGLEGATDEEIETFSEEFLSEATDLRDEIEATQDVALRSSTGWAMDTYGNARLRTRNGITTPIVGSRRAWTEAKTERRTVSGAWVATSAELICVDAGVNTQTETVCHGGGSCQTSVIESENPPNHCTVNTGSWTRMTTHDRNNGTFPLSQYKLRARGSASAQVFGLQLSAAAGTHTRVY